MSIDVWPLVEQTGTDAGERDFINCWQPIGRLFPGRTEVGERALLEVVRDAGTLQAGNIDPNWGGGWRWDMSTGAAKAVLASGLIYGVLAMAGVSGLLPLVVPAVMPLLFELEKVRLTQDGEKIINIIGVRAGVFARSGAPHQLYESLPAEVRGSLLEEEFNEFLNAAIEAGIASQNGEVVEVLPTGESVFRLRLV